MQLDASEIHDLAAFCARRFPSGAQRSELARVAGLTLETTDQGDAQGDWARLLELAQGRGALDRLAGALADAAPNDENLRAATALLRPRPTSGRFLVAGTAAGALVGLGILVVLAWPAPTVVPVAQAAAVPEPAVAPPEAVVEVAAPAPAAPEAVAVPPPKEKKSGCKGEVGEVVGYWYAGTRSPGAVGETITLPRDARVRADYPRAENGNDPRKPERCALKRGATITLSHAPIDASNGHYWVPYAVGDGG
jgi:hypothetical protein